MEVRESGSFIKRLTPRQSAFSGNIGFLQKNRIVLSDHRLKWVFLFTLALLWGSSFILIKKGLSGVSPLELGALRTLFAGIFLVMIGFRSLRKVKGKIWYWLILSGLLGTFFPSILFSYAETEIDSAIASILNSTVPLQALVVGIIFFKGQFISNQFIGVLIGLLGSFLLIWIGSSLRPDQNYWFALLPIFASLMYAFNANIIKFKLKELSALSITTASFLLLIPTSLGVLIATDFFTFDNLEKASTQTALWYILALALLGTTFAKIIFNRLVQLSNPVFSTSVTYLIPLVALFWGILDGEQFQLLQLLAGAVILLGVYLSNRKKKLRPQKNSAGKRSL